MDIKNWVNMLKGDNSGLKKDVIEVGKVTEDKKYRLKFASGQNSTLVKYDEAIRQVNSFMNREGWNWIKITNEDTKKDQIVREPSSMINRGFLHLKKLSENVR